MAELQETPLRIVLLGKSGDGKSSAGNTILGENVFNASSSPESGTVTCQSRTDKNNRITVIDTPGLFDTTEILRMVVESSPGPHAFVIVLKVGRYTEQEEQVVEKLLGLFGEEALKFTIIVFTRGEELDENERIDQFVKKNDKLKSFVDKCGGRCHVLDNKYWRNSQDEYRNNKVQVEKIINTVQTMVGNNSGHYTNEMMRDVQEKIQEEEKRLRQGLNTDLSDGEITAQAKEKVDDDLLKELGSNTIWTLMRWIYDKIFFYR